MTLLNTLKLTSGLSMIVAVSLAVISPTFDVGIFLSGFMLGWFLLLLLEDMR